MPLDADRIAALLGLTTLRGEGGRFRETYRAPLEFPERTLPPVYGAARAASTAIYYLLSPDTFSALHRLRGDEVYHFYLGDAVELLQLHPNGRGEVTVLGADLEAGMRPQLVVPATVWQGARLRPGGRYALLGTTMAPGFDFADCELGTRAALTRQFPACAALVRALTHDDEGARDAR
jgi:uncharacterized protein